MCLDRWNKSAFAHNVGMGRSLYKSARPQSGEHTVGIIATDATGNTITETSSLKVVRW